MSSGYSSGDSIFSDQIQQYIQFSQSSTAPTNHRKVKRGSIIFTYSKLKELIGLPEDCEILGFVSDYTGVNTLRIIVSSPNCPEITEGMTAPTITLQTLQGFDE